MPRTRGRACARCNRQRDTTHHVDHPHLDQESGLRDDGDGRITVLGVFSYQRLNVEQMPDVSLPFVLDHDALSGRGARGGRGRRHEADRIRGQPGVRRQAHLLELARRVEPGLRRVPAVDRRRRARCRTCATRSRRCGRRFPQDVKDPLVDPRRQREPAADRVARRACRRRPGCASSRRSPTRRSSRRSRTSRASRASTSTAA